MIAICPYCKKVRQLVYYSNIDAYQCVVCGGIVKNPREVEQRRLSE